MNNQQDPNQQRPQHPLANYQFSSEELRVLRECNTESFFQRSLPFGTAFGLAAYFGTQHGYLKPNVKYGAVPKVIVGIIIGYFMGKFSYQQKCAEKIMQLPNSKLAEVLRQRKRGSLMDTLTTDQGIGSSLALSPFTPNVPDVYSDEFVRGRGNTLDMNVETNPTISGLDDIYRPSLDNSTSQYEPEIPIEPAKPGTTYEDLRKVNREEYLKRQQTYNAPPRSQSVAPEAYATRPSARPTTESDFNSNKGQTNKYGDTWTN